MALSVVEQKTLTNSEQFCLLNSRLNRYMVFKHFQRCPILGLCPQTDIIKGSSS